MNLTPPEVRDLGDFPNRNAADADAYVAAASTWGATAPLWAQDLVGLGAWMATLAADQAAAFPPGAIVVTYTFDGTSAAVADRGAGKVGLNNLTQGSATALIADALDNLGASATATLARMTSTSAPLGSILMYKFGDPSKRLLADVTANTPSGGGTGYVNLTLTNVTVSTTNPFADGDSLVLVLDPRGSKGDQGIQGPTANWTLDTTYTVTGSPTLITFTTPSGFNDLKFEIDGIVPSSAAAMAAAASVNGSSFGGAVSLISNFSHYTGVLVVHGYRGDMSLGVPALSTGAISSPNGFSKTDPYTAVWKHTGGMAAFQFSFSGVALTNAGSIKMFKR
jgi:hypothetical protein